MLEWQSNLRLIVDFGLKSHTVYVCHFYSTAQNSSTASNSIHDIKYLAISWMCARSSTMKSVIWGTLYGNRVWLDLWTKVPKRRYCHCHWTLFPGSWELVRWACVLPRCMVRPRGTHCSSTSVTFLILTVSESF